MYHFYLCFCREEWLMSGPVTLIFIKALSQLILLLCVLTSYRTAVLLEMQGGPYDFDSR